MFYCKSRKVICTLGLVFSLAVSNLFTQQKQAEMQINQNNIKTNEFEKAQTVQLPKIVVTERKMTNNKIKSLTLIDTPALELPMSYEVMDKQVLNDFAISKFSDTLEYTSGVRMTEPAFLGTAAGGATSIRGFGNTETTINGFSLPKEVNLFLDTACMDRIEYFKGSIASIQGANSSYSNGVGGGINIVTKTPASKFFCTNSLQVEYGEGNIYRDMIDFNIPIYKNISFRFNGAVEKEKPFYLPSDYDPNTCIFLAPSLTLTPINKLELTFQSIYQRNEAASYYGIPPEIKDRPSICDIDTYYGNKDTRTHYENIINQASAKWSFNDIFSINAGVSQMYAKITADIIGLGFGVANGYTTLNFFNKVYETGTSPFSKLYLDTTYDRWKYNFNFIAHNKLSEITNTVVSGCDFLISKSDSISKTASSVQWYKVNEPLPSSVIFPSAAPTHTETTTKQIGFFVEDQIEWKSWRLIAGGRSDSYESINDITDASYNANNIISSRFGLTYLFTSKLSIYGNFINTCGPNLGIYDYSGNLITDNWSSVMTEIGIKTQLFNDMDYTLSAFKIYENNLPVYDLVLRNTAQLTGQEESAGFESTISGNITDKWNIKMSYTYIEEKNNSSTTPKTIWQNIPKHDASLIQTYKIPCLNTKIGMTNKYVSERDITYRGQFISDDYKLKPYFVTGLFTEYSFQGVSLRLNVNNVFNTVYFTGVRHVTKASPGEPFNIALTLITKF